MTEITPLPYQGSIPFSTATPFTYREGTTMLELIHALKDWAVKVVPDLNGVLESFWAKYLEDHQALLESLEVTKDNWKDLFDQFMADVVAQLEALNDQAMANLVKNSSSVFYQALLEAYSYGARVDDYGVAGAISKAYTDKSVVYIAGENPVTGNIPNLWNVDFAGMGSITRGGYTFIPNPKPSPVVHTNTIFVHAQNGNDNNDGLTPDLPLKTLSRMHTLLRGLTSEQAAGAMWEVRISGTFPNGQRMHNLPDFPHELRILGDAPVSGFPVTRINNTTASSTIGLWFEKCPSTVVVEDIHFDGFNASTGYGVLGKGSGDLRVRRCRFSNCSYGTAAIKNMDFFFRDNYYESTCTNGSMAQYNSSGTWNNDTFDGCNRGVYVTRNTVAHVDYCKFINNNYGTHIDMASRAHLLGSNFKRCNVGVRVLGAAEWINDTSTNFNVGTVDGNVEDYQHFGNGRETRLYSSDAWSEYKVGDAWRANSAYIDGRVMTGSTNNDVVYVGSALGRIPENFFTARSKRLRVVVRGRVATANSYSSTVSLHVLDENGSGNASVATGVIPGGLEGSFTMEFIVYAMDTAAQKYHVNTIGAGNRCTSYSGDRSVNMRPQKLIRLYNRNEVVGDRVEFLGMETYLMG